MPVSLQPSCPAASMYLTLYAAFCTRRPGMRADFVVLDQSPLDMAPGGPLPEVLNTYVNGQCRHGC